MYIYFDKNGYLQEFINYPIRQGAINANKIYIYIERSTNLIVDGVYKLPAMYTVCVMNFQLPKPIENVTDENGNLLNPYTFGISSKKVTKEIPYDEKRDLKYFKYFKQYEFIEFTLQAPITTNNGDVNCTVNLINDLDSDGEWDDEEEFLPLDTFSFHVQSSVVVKEVQVTASQYHYLLGLVEKGFENSLTVEDQDYVIPPEDR